MASFADRLIEGIRAKNSRCVIGLDPRVDQMPAFIEGGVCAAITGFHELVLDAVADLVPAVKPQLAFFEQYGVAGMQAFENTVHAAKKRGLLVIADGKRNDISSTAEAYANAYLGRDVFDCDALTVTPYMGRDSLEPFVEACKKHGKGLFVILKTSNPGSKDFEDQPLQATGRPLYEKIAGVLNELGDGLTGQSGYSSMGAVIGATFPDEGRRLRALMPKALILVPGYGAQGGSAKAAAECFHEDGLGAIVNSSRGITYAFGDRNISREAFVRSVRENTSRMIADINLSLADRRTLLQSPALPLA
ncbi:MAG TPA: orotidine-5'-phosphate decarboxylase [Bryobacteraceae bacterium]|jgi:orotidine-5'-phosphate decarboxylase|nr:orotidine-5'-phosphate decarboxylase [Bryobacteraceae bacterium]